MAKKIKDLPKHMQYTYGAQPSPIAGAQLIFLNEMTEMLEELRTEVSKISEAKDLSPAFDSLSSQFKQSISELSAIVKANKPKAQSLSPVTKALKALNDRPSSIGSIENLSARLQTLIDTEAQVLAQLKEMDRPKRWRFEINRDNLKGHIIDVVAIQEE